jgi:hypothetical protein
MSTKNLKYKHIIGLLIIGEASVHLWMNESVKRVKMLRIKLLKFEGFP